jgi:cysteinyl-tRNA synthetase
MQATCGPSSTPCSPLLNHARHTSKEPEGTREARLSYVWWTKRRKALDPALDIHRTIDDATLAGIETLVDARTKARQARNWQEADRIRKELDER